MNASCATMIVMQGMKWITGRRNHPASCPESGRTLTSRSKPSAEGKLVNVLRRRSLPPLNARFRESRASCGFP